MAKQRLSLTRDQFASFLNDFEQIKQFEQLFTTVDTIDTVTLDEINTSAGTANAAANEALSGIAVLNDLVAPLITAPPPTNGTVTSVAANGGTTGMTFTGSPITTNGTLVLGGTLAITNGGTGATNATDARLNLSAAQSGANSDITSLSGITGSISTVDSITFDTAAAITVGQGQIAWNADDGTIDIGMGYDAVTQQVGLEQYFRIKASATITDGQCIMFTGSVGASGVLKGAPATGVSNPQYVMGVATMDIANNGFGYVTSFGLVRGINTTGSSVGETWVDGDILYYNPAFTGGLTKVPPTAPLPKVIVAAVVNAGPGGSGSLFIRVQGEPDLHNLSDVYAPSPISNGQILIGDGPQSRWEATTLTPGSGVSITNAAGAITIAATGSGGTVTSVSVVSANGFAGTVATATTTPAITLSTSVTGLVKGNGTALSAAVAATDYVAPSAYASANGLTMATSRLLGRTTASTGAAEEISVAGGLTLSAGVLTGASGTVTSVSGTGTVNGITLTGTVTSSGSLTLGGTLSGVSLTTQVSGTLPIANGGTNGTSTPTAGAVPYGTGTAYAFTAAGTSGQVLTSAGAGVPTWTTPTTGTVTSVTGTAPVVSSGGATPAISMAAATTSVNGYLTSTDWTTFNGKQAALVSGTNIKTVGGVSLLGAGDVGTIGAAYGGTGQSSYTVGDILYASATTTLSKLADVATGNALISGGVGVAPLYGKIGLTTHISGTLAVGNGGTGATTLTSGYLLKGNGTSAVSASVIYDTGTNVGIGTPSPGSKLDVSSSSFNIVASRSTGSFAAFQRFAPTGQQVYDFYNINGVEAARISVDGANFMAFSTGSAAAERMRINSTGLGIGVTNPQQLLALGNTTDQVGAGVSGAVTTVYFGTPSNIAGGIKRIAYDRAAGTLNFIGGSVATPVTQMTLDGANNLLCPGVYSATVGATNRDVFVDNTGLIGYVPSILASKTNVADLSDTSWLDALHPITFNYRKRDEDGIYTDEAEAPLEYGLIAEEVEKINTELVFYDETEDGIELRGVSYRKLIIPLLKEVQSLRARVAALEGE